MKTNSNTQQSSNSFQLFKSMVGIGLICAALIATVYQSTAERIKKLKAEALEQAVYQVIPGMKEKKTFMVNNEGEVVPVQDGSAPAELIFAGYGEDGRFLGLAIQASGMGFADVIKVIYGYDPQKQLVIGYRVLDNKETPGLGDKIEKDEDFLANFKALDVSLTDDRKTIKNTVTTVKNGQKKNAWEIDGITGATISSRAIGAIFQESTQKWMPIIADNIQVFTNDTSLSHGQ
ncbi:MAG: FMN-binding protein [Saprospiraceae bacterium]|nr:FMN-binding protein [Saprospiraceae bacterium]